MKLKEKLENQYQKWQEKLESRIVGDRDIFMANSIRISYTTEFITHRGILEHAVLTTGDEEMKQELTLLINEVYQFTLELIEKIDNFVHLGNNIIDEQQGLTPQRIQQFEQFTADESFVGDQCVICMGDIEIGRNMMRLDCDGQHTFCQVCIEGWFADHKTCPNCRHVFQNV